MLRRYVLLVFVSGTIAYWLSALAHGDERTAESRVSAQVRPVAEPKVSAQLVPLVTLRSNDLDLRFLFYNDSQAPLKYLDFGPYIGQLRFTLSRDGVVQKPQVHTTSSLTRDKVKVLEPGATKEVRLALGEIYGELAPGRYALDASMTGRLDEFGLSRISFERRVLYVDVVRAE